MVSGNESGILYSEYAFDYSWLSKYYIRFFIAFAMVCFLYLAKDGELSHSIIGDGSLSSFSVISSDYRVSSFKRL